MKSMFRKHKLLIVAGLMGLSAMLVSYAAISPFVSTVPVVVAVRDIEQYSKIEPADLRIVSHPLKALPKEHFKAIGDASGAYALSRILAGQVVLSGHIAKGTQGAGLSLELSSEMRCVFVPAGPERAVGGLIKRGEKVDVVFTPKSGTYLSLGNGPQLLVVPSLTVVEVCQEASSRLFSGVVVSAERTDAEAIAHNLETCDLSLLLTPRDAWAEVEPGAWSPR